MEISQCILKNKYFNPYFMYERILKSYIEPQISALFICFVNRNDRQQPHPVLVTSRNLYESSPFPKLN